ncbi:MAG: hypothetical protein R3C44_09050 [Chloroflexota bacterium]
MSVRGSFLLADNIYRDAEEDFMWLGTAEIALTNLHRMRFWKKPTCR